MDGKIRFASFELDPAAGELRKAGVRVPLSGQPLDVLALLASRPGEVVTREELKEALWTDGTFVDFDDGVNTAIRRIRRALDDSATHPRFIETLPKRGYRFIGDVESPRGDGLDHSKESRSWHRRTFPVAALAAGTIALGWRWLGPATQNDTAGVAPLSEPVNLTTLPGIERDPTFSPDGSHVAFAWNGEDRADFDICVKPVSGGDEPLRLTDDLADDIMPAWSPDGQTVAFWRSQGDRSGIYLVSPQGKNERPLFADRPAFTSNQDYTRRSQLSWSPDSKWIAFTDTGVTPPIVAAISVETREVKPLTDGAGRGDICPAFSPDGASLAWARAGGQEGGLYVMSLDGGGPRRLTAQGSRASPATLAWSADSRSLLAMSAITGDLVKIDVASGRHEIVSGVRGAGPPAVSAAGRLAYIRRFPNLDVAAVDMPTAPGRQSKPHWLLASTTAESMAQISPDGSSVVLGSRRSGRWEFWLTRRDGSGARQLPFGGAAPRWSPYGGRIAFDSHPPGGSWGIYVTDSGGRAPQHLTDPEKYCVQPCWSEDGESLFFAQGTDETNAHIWRIPYQGGEPRQVTVGRGVRCWASGGWLYFGRDSGVWRIRLDGEGDEEQVLTEGLFPDSGHWQVLGDRLYFIDFQKGWTTGDWTLSRLDLSSGEIIVAADLPQEPSERNGLSVAPDENWFLYTVDNTNEQDLMMIEGSAP